MVAAVAAPLGGAPPGLDHPLLTKRREAAAAPLASPACALAPVARSALALALGPQPTAPTVVAQSLGLPPPVARLVAPPAPLLLLLRWLKVRVGRGAAALLPGPGSGPRRLATAAPGPHAPVRPPSVPAPRRVPPPPRVRVATPPVSEPAALTVPPYVAQRTATEGPMHPLHPLAAGSRKAAHGERTPWVGASVPTHGRSTPMQV